MAKIPIRPVPGPIVLPPERREELEDLEAYIAYLEKEITKAEEAELDVADMRADFEKHKRLRLNLLRLYG